MDPAVLALIGTLCGGIGLKLTEHYFGRSKIKFDDAARIRDELRIQLTNQQEKISSLEADRDKWKMDYYDLRDRLTKLETELAFAIQALKDQQNE